MSVLIIVLPLMLMLSTSRSPVTSTPPVTASADPLQVKFASSSNAPEVPTTTSLLSVKSLTVNVLATTSPVPSGVILTSPLCQY